MTLKRFFVGTAAVALTASMTYAQGRLVQETPHTPYTSTGLYFNQFANNTHLLSTGFETGDGWDLNHSVCGEEFAFGPVCTYPVAGTGSCVFKNHAANQNCCPEDAHNAAIGDPNEDTGWCMSPSSRHCREPSIRDVNPHAGTQHLRFQYDPQGGVPTGCTGFGSACRTRAITAQTALPEVMKVVWQYEVNISGRSGPTLLSLYGQDTTVGSIHSNSYHYWLYSGGLYVYSYEASEYTGLYWYPDEGTYVNYSMEFDPCNNTSKITYNGTVILEEPYYFTPPYGSTFTDLRRPNTDTAFYTTDHIPGQTIDIDDHFVTYTPCSDACCDGDTGTCTDGVDQAACSGDNHHWYENTTCAQLGTCVEHPTFGLLFCYPPTCDLDTGSCCDTSPLAGGPEAAGVCSNEVTQANCSGAQRVWTRGANCGSVRDGLCLQGGGNCLTGFCSIGRVGEACATSRDCDVTGMCLPRACSVSGAGCFADADCGAAGGMCTIPLPNAGERCLVNDDCDAPAAPACLETTGACCDLITGDCVDGAIRADCPDGVPGTLDQHSWTKGATCADVEAAGGCNAEIGACCDGDTFGACVDTSYANCQCEKCVWSKLATCATLDPPCTHEAIPTVSEWGLVVLTLLLLTGAKVYFGRRQAIA